MTWDPLKWVLEHLQENDASAGDLMLARKRGKELKEKYIKAYGGANSETERYILDTLKAEFGITTPVLDKDQEILERRTKSDLLERTKDFRIRGEIFKGWGRKNKEGD